MKCSRKLYGTHVSMTKQSGDFQKLIFKTTITHNTIIVIKYIIYRYYFFIFINFNNICFRIISSHF